ICSGEVLTHFHGSDDCIFVANNELIVTGLIKYVAQTCSAIPRQHYFNKKPATEVQTNRSLIGFISYIKKITVYKLPEINQLIQTKAHLISQVRMPGYSICTLKVTTFHSDTLFLEGEMNLFLQKR